MKAPSNGFLPNPAAEGERKNINSELWHACAGPLVNLPPVGSLVVYFPQGHSEQVSASMQKVADFVPSYPNLPSKLICMLHNATLHADLETDEVYAQMTLQPVSKYDREALMASEMALKHNRQPAEFFCKTLTASDTSTHGGFSVPRRAAEKIFPPLDFSMQPPAQELVARDLHDNSWTFRHIYRGQPKRHLLTTGWSVFVSNKRLFAGDSVLFIRDEKQQLLLGIRHANRQQSALASSVISSDSMHIGILAAAAHAAANNSPFTIFYNPRASPSEFVVPLAKYNKAMYTQVSLGMRFRMMFETEESGVRRYMGTITGISDFDTVRWKNSQWRNLQVGWDESTAGDRPSRVSIWEIEPVVTPFYICPPPFFRPKFPRQPDDESDIENAFKRAMPWLGDEFGGMKDAAPNSIFPGLSLVQWMSMQQQNNQFPSPQSGFFPSMVNPAALHNSNLGTDDPSKLLNFQSPTTLPQANMQFNKVNLQNQVEQLPQPPVGWPQQQPQPQALTQHQTQPQMLTQHQPQPIKQQQQTAQQLVPQQLQQLSPHHHQQQQLFQSASQPIGYSQLQQQQSLSSNSSPPPQSLPVTNKNLYPMTSSSMPQDNTQFQRQIEPSLLQRHQQQAQPSLQMSQRTHQQQSHVPQQPQQGGAKGVSEQQFQLQMLQKMQQQQQQIQQQKHQQQVSSGNSLFRTQQQQAVQQNQHSQKFPHSQNQQPFTSNSFSSSLPVHSQPFPGNQPQKTPTTLMRAQSGVTDGDAPSCSTSPSTNNCQLPPSDFLNRNKQLPSLLMGDSLVQPTTNLLEDLKSKNEIRFKQELPSAKVQFDQLEASTSGTSYCLEAGGNMQQSFSLPPFCVESDIQSHSRGSIPFNIDGGLEPDTLLSREYDSQKDLQNLLANYGTTPRDIETELSTAGISSQSFGVPNISFKPGCSTDIGFNDAGVLNNELWANQTQPRMRTYTKVQKRGSVGRSIDVTRYNGYDELRRDLARMFGIEGQLEDPQSSDWKLVFMDPENDMLLVGDDPWEDFIRCVQSIKILSAVEVQNMSLAGDLGNVSVPNQACSGTDSGNAWRGHYDDNSAASFNR